ncbi:hypothetical protein SADUNF_Sadunf13G0125400 [Salix dunnii]|uniref:Uncharacterized protein n=1 Tax=Salix dunnii TaxID=1413687 RepID=A0A835JIN2_9ROSI|nr:hypothetical protein SADUNF_Sadunf13G0125400 [Salix dunnii]
MTTLFLGVISLVSLYGNRRNLQMNKPCKLPVRFPPNHHLRSQALHCSLLSDNSAKNGACNCTCCSFNLHLIYPLNFPFSLVSAKLYNSLQPCLEDEVAGNGFVKPTDSGMSRLTLMD